MASQALPGETEVHYIGTQIPNQPGDYIPNSTLTKYRLGYYQFTQNGTNLMQNAGNNIDTETPNVWVIPGVIEVNVPPPQMNTQENTIRSNGVYNLVDTDDNPDDIEIEPDANANNRGILIKSGKTVKTFKLEKTRDGDDDDDADEEEEEDSRLSLGQIIVNVPIPPQPSIGQISNYPITTNGIQSVSVPTGYDAVNNITLDVNVPQITVPTQIKDVIYYGRGNYTVRPDTGYNLSEVNVEVDVPSPPIIGNISDYPITSNGIQNIPMPSGYDAVNSIRVDVTVPSNVNNTSVNADNEITQNGTFTVPNGFTGWNSFTVNVGNANLLTVNAVVFNGTMYPFSDFTYVDYGEYYNDRDWYGQLYFIEEVPSVGWKFYSYSNQYSYESVRGIVLEYPHYYLNVPNVFNQFERNTYVINNKDDTIQNSQPICTVNDGANQWDHVDFYNTAFNFVF